MSNNNNGPKAFEYSFDYNTTGDITSSVQKGFFDAYMKYYNEALPQGIYEMHLNLNNGPRRRSVKLYFDPKDKLIEKCEIESANPSKWWRPKKIIRNREQAYETEVWGRKIIEDKKQIQDNIVMFGNIASYINERDKRGEKITKRIERIKSILGIGKKRVGNVDVPNLTNISAGKPLCERVETPRIQITDGARQGSRGEEILGR